MTEDDCPCTRERVLAMIRSLGPEEIEEMIRDQGGAEVTCEFCGAVYSVSADELRALQGE